jgi:nucleoside-diphosphate-sugar epimerase
MDELKGRRMMVTGASGFVGANLVRELLKQGAEVHGLLRPGTERWRIREVLPHLIVHPVDLTDHASLKRIVASVRPEIVFHLAARRIAASNQDHRETLMVNVSGTFNLLEAISSLDYRRFVYLGSSTEYGSKVEPMQESDPLEPVTFFGATKAAATLICQQFARTGNRPVVILRSFSIYGYWDSPTRLIPTAIMAALNHRQLLLTAPGYRRDYLFIEDLVEAFLLALKAKDIDGQVINIASGQQTTNEDVVDLIQELTGQRIEVKAGGYPARGHDKTFWVADIRKAKKLLGWEPSHTLRSGLEKTIAWFRRHKEAYDTFRPNDRSNAL